jgi:hypothetical protein
MVIQMVVVLLLLLLVLELNCCDTGTVTGTGGASEALHEFFKSGLVGLDEGGSWSCYWYQRGGRGRRRPVHDFSCVKQWLYFRPCMHGKKQNTFIKKCKRRHERYAIIL